MTHVSPLAVRRAGKRFADATELAFNAAVASAAKPSDSSASRMQVIDLPHGFGKTTTLVKLMLEPGNEDVIYVAPTLEQAQRGALEMALHSADWTDYERRALRKRFISVGMLIENRADYARNRFVIDELEAVLEKLLRGEVLAVAATSGTRYHEGAAAA